LLRPLFGKEKITMFEVGKIINANLTGEGARSAQKSSQSSQNSSPRKKAA